MFKLKYILLCFVGLFWLNILQAQQKFESVFEQKDISLNASLENIFKFKKDNTTDSLLSLFIKAEKEQNLSIQADLLYHLGNHFLNSGQFTLAIIAYEQAIAQHKKCSPYPALPALNTIINLVNAYASNSQYERALEVSIMGLKIADTKLEAPTSDSLKIYLYINMSLIFIELDQDDKALYYLDLAENLSNQKSFIPFSLNIINSKGILADNKKEWKKSRTYYNQVIKIADSIHNDEFKYLALGNLGISFYRSGELDEAKKIFLNLINNSFNIPFHKRNEAIKMVAEILYKQEKHSEAIPFFEQSIDNAFKINLAQDAIHAHLHLSKIYEANGDFKKALYHSKINNELIDSIAKSESIDKINQLEILYRSAENEKRIRENEYKIEQQQAAISSKNLMLFSISILIILLSLLFLALLKILKDKQKRRLKTISHDQLIFAQEQEMLQLKTAIEAEQKERSRIARELHDGIGGMLSAITMNIGAFNKKNTADNDGLVETMLRNVAQEVRNIAHNLMPDALLQKSFAEALLQYKNSINAGQQFPLHLEIYGDIDWIKNDVKILLYRIIQELIQNAIRHSQSNDMYLQFIEHEESLQITFEDNGKGFDINLVERGQGLQNIESRVQTLKGDYSIQSSKDKGTTVLIEFEKVNLK